MTFLQCLIDDHDNDGNYGLDKNEIDHQGALSCEGSTMHCNIAMFDG